MHPFAVLLVCALGQREPVAGVGWAIPANEGATSASALSLGANESAVLLGFPATEADRLGACGRIAVVRPEDGALLWEALGSARNGQLGRQVWSGFDLNRDGVEDIAARRGAPRVAPGGPAGIVLFQSSGQRAWIQTRALPAGAFDELQVLEDVDGDSVDDFLIGGAGAFRVLDPVTGRTICEHGRGSAAPAQNGIYSRFRACDLDGDGQQDVAMSSYRLFASTRDPLDEVRIVRWSRGEDGFETDLGRSIDLDTNGGLGVCADLDGDGSNELLISQRRGGRRVIVWSPERDDVLRVIEGPADDAHFGASIEARCDRTWFLVGGQGLYVCDLAGADSQLRCLYRTEGLQRAALELSRFDDDESLVRDRNGWIGLCRWSPEPVLVAFR